MNKRRHSILSDLSFQVILILMFVAILFLSFDHANLAQNGILLCIATLLFMVTYFTSVRIGLVLDIIFVFLLVAYVVFQSVNMGSKVNTNVYFWLVWPIGMIVSISGYIGENKILDMENRELVRRVEKYVTIDELTQMNNLLGFERDASVYMNISRRYKIELELVLWKLTFQEDLERLLGTEDTQIAISMISDAIKNALRKEDLVYLVDKTPYIWGTLLFSKSEAAEIVISHVKNSVASVNFENLTSQKSFSSEISGAVLTYDGSMMTPLAFLNKAKRLLWNEQFMEKPKEAEVFINLKEKEVLGDLKEEEAAGLEEVVEHEETRVIESQINEEKQIESSSKNVPNCQKKDSLKEDKREDIQNRLAESKRKKEKTNPIEHEKKGKKSSSHHYTGWHFKFGRVQKGKKRSR